MPFGRLPGDITVRRGNSTFYFPIATSIIVSIILTLLLSCCGGERFSERTLAIKADRWIKKMALEHGMIEPFEERQVRAGVVSYGLSSYGYDIRVADEFKVFTNVNNALIDPKNFDPRSFVDIKSDTVIVPPNSFALARTIEYFRIPRDVLTVCLGKSTYARCGIIVNVTPSSRSGKARRRWKSPTRRRCRPRSTPTRASRRCCSSRATSRARFRTPTRRASTSASRK